MMRREEEYHWVFRDGKPYLRRVPYTYDNPSPAQRRTRADLALAAFKSRNRWGKTEIIGADGRVREVVHPAKSVQEELKGVKVQPPRPKPATTYKHLVLDPERVRSLLEALARAR